MFVCWAMGMNAQDMADHRSAQLATHGTDFWCCVPRTWNAMSQNARTIHIIAERDCDVTISSPLLGWHETYHIIGRRTINLHMDTINSFDLPEYVLDYCDTLLDYDNLSASSNFSTQPGINPQPHSIHITSTDTIAVYFTVFGVGSFAATNIFPTEVLRDEYMVCTYPMPEPMGGSFVDIVATEDNTVVDIVLNRFDWMNRHPGDTVTVTLHQGQLYHICNGHREYHLPPLRERPLGFTTLEPRTVNGFFPTWRTVYYDTALQELSGTHIKARDHKRIAVFDGVLQCNVPHELVANSDLIWDQALPLRYAGKEYLVPDLAESDSDYIRFTALENNTVVTIHDDTAIHRYDKSYTLNRGETGWFQRMPGEGAFLIQSNHPIVAKLFSMGNNYTEVGDPSMLTLVPTDWWHSGATHNYTACWADNNHNRYVGFYYTHIFCRTEDVPGMRIDSYAVDTLFRPVGGTSYSYALIPETSNYNSLGNHEISNVDGGCFWAVMDTPGYGNHAVWNMSHIQPGSTFLTVNGLYHDSLNIDSIWCLYDTIHLHAWSERPADSIMWDLGDGTQLRMSYDEGQYIDHIYTDTGRYIITRIITWHDEGAEDCISCNSAFTRKPDTLSAHVWFHNHYDSIIPVRLCEGSYTFRNETYETTGEYYQTTYWTPSGCDTLWKIDLVTCPHCTEYFDTVNIEDLPRRFNGMTFNTDVKDGIKVYLDLDDDECDSIITYYLVVIKQGERLENFLDSIMISVPTVFTPSLESNNRFKVIGSPQIKQIEVNLFNRYGMKVAQFDGMTETWDGTKEGTPLPQGTYVYYIRYMDTSNSGWKTIKGSVLLLR